MIKRLIKNLFFLVFIIIMLITAALFALSYYDTNISENIITEEEVRQVLSADQILSNPRSGFAQLTAEEQAAYLRINNEIQNLNSDFSLIGNSVSEEQFNKITTFILKDHPEYFYIDTIEYLKTPDGMVENVTMNYSADNETILQQQLEVENWKNYILSGITPEMNNYDIAKYLHDYLVQTTTYDETVANNQNVLSVVESASSVCAGYSKAYQYLLNQAGIFSTYVSGTADIGSHAWNLVEINGEYGWVDVTWDDPSFVDNNIPDEYQSHTYFGISTEELEKTHWIDTQYETFPMIPEPSFNYFYREDLNIDLDELGAYSSFSQKLREAKANGEATFEVRLKDQNQVDVLLNQLTYDPYLVDGTITYISDPNYPIITFIL